MLDRHEVENRQGTTLRCFGCGAVFDSVPLRYDCSKCGWPLEFLSPGPELSAQGIERMLRSASSLWGFSVVLPYCGERSIVTLGEGATPLLRSTRGLTGDIASLYLKAETHNPTGSFKDRPMAVISSYAKEHTVRQLVAASSGNAGVSLAAYGAAAGIPAVVFLPATTSPEKLIPIRAFGARVLRVDGTSSDAVRIAHEMCLAGSGLNATTTFKNPLGLEADKTVAYEIARDLDFDVPDYVFIPIGAGPLLVGCYKGFHDLLTWGVAKRMPRLIGVQAEGCAPIARAFTNGEQVVEAWDRPATIASGIADPLVGYESDGTLTLQHIRASNGYTVTVSDDDTLLAARLLAERMGLLVEPTAATSLAAALSSAHRLERRATVVCVLTGSGFKALRDQAPRNDLAEIIPAEATVRDVLRFLKT